MDAPRGCSHRFYAHQRIVCVRPDPDGRLIDGRIYTTDRRFMSGANQTVTVKELPGVAFHADRFAGRSVADVTRETYGYVPR